MTTKLPFNPARPDPMWRDFHADSARVNAFGETHNELMARLYREFPSIDPAFRAPITRPRSDADWADHLYAAGHREPFRSVGACMEALRVARGPQTLARGGEIRHVHTVLCAAREGDVSDGTEGV